MVYKNLCVLVLCTKVASALEESSVTKSCLHFSPEKDSSRCPKPPLCRAYFFCFISTPGEAGSGCPKAPQGELSGVPADGAGRS